MHPIWRLALLPGAVKEQLDQRNHRSNQQHEPVNRQGQFRTVAAGADGVHGDQGAQYDRATGVHDPPGLISPWKSISFDRCQDQGGRKDPGGEPGRQRPAIDRERRVGGVEPGPGNAIGRGVEKRMNKDERNDRVGHQSMNAYGAIDPDPARDPAMPSGKQELDQQRGECDYRQGRGDFVKDRTRSYRDMKKGQAQWNECQTHVDGYQQPQASASSSRARIVISLRRNGPIALARSFLSHSPLPVA